MDSDLLAFRVDKLAGFIIFCVFLTLYCRAGICEARVIGSCCLDHNHTGLVNVMFCCVLGQSAAESNFIEPLLLVVLF